MVAILCIYQKYSQGHNPIVFFFAMVSVVLWSKTLLLDHEQLPQLLNIDLNIMLYMLLVSVVTGLGYAAWNIRINSAISRCWLLYHILVDLFVYHFDVGTEYQSIPHLLDRYDDGYLRFIYLLAVDQLE